MCNELRLTIDCYNVSAVNFNYVCLFSASRHLEKIQYSLLMYTSGLVFFSILTLGPE